MRARWKCTCEIGMRYRPSPLFRTVRMDICYNIEAAKLLNIKIKMRYIALTAGIMLLATGCGKAAIVQNTNSTTTKADPVPNVRTPTNWKTYQNPIGYQISYPSSWYAIDQTQGREYFAESSYLISPDQTGGSSSNAMFQITVLRDDVEAVKGKMSSPPEEVNLNGNAALKWKITPNVGSYADIYLMEYDGKAFHINYRHDPSFGSSQEEGEKILASFRFVKK